MWLATVGQGLVAMLIRLGAVNGLQDSNAINGVHGSC